MPPHSTHPVPGRSTAMRVDAVDRRLSLMTVPGTILLVLSSADVPSESGTGTPSWNALAAAFCVVLIGAGLLPLLGLSRFAQGRLPVASMTRGTWALLPFLGIALNAGWFWQPNSEQALVPWTWILGPSVIGLATLALPPSLAYLVALCWALSVPAGAVLADVPVSQEVLALTAVHAADVVFVGLYLIVRRQLRARYDSERQAAHSGADLVRAHENALQRARVTALVHDDVLTPLNAAALGHEAGALTASAIAARRLVRDEIESLTQEVSALQAAIHQSSAIQSPAVQSPAVQSSAIQSPVIQNSTVQTSAVQSPALQSSVVQSSVLEATRRPSPSGRGEHASLASAHPMRPAGLMSVSDLITHLRTVAEAQPFGWHLTARKMRDFPYPRLTLWLEQHGSLSATLCCTPTEAPVRSS